MGANKENKVMYSRGPWRIWDKRRDVILSADDTAIACNITNAHDVRVMSLTPELISALKAIAYVPWGYCVCPSRMGVMEGKDDAAHCGECRDVRSVLARVDGQVVDETANES